MKYIVAVLSFLTGGYMLADGIYVMLNGKYIGPPQPGPWAFLFRQLGIDVFKLGPLFIAFGLAWLYFLVRWLKNRPRYRVGVILSIFTLWYLPVGTLFSVIIFIVLLRMQSRL